MYTHQNAFYLVRLKSYNFARGRGQANSPTCCDAVAEYNEQFCFSRVTSQAAGQVPPVGVSDFQGRDGGREEGTLRIVPWAEVVAPVTPVGVLCACLNCTIVFDILN